MCTPLTNALLMPIKILGLYCAMILAVAACAPTTSLTLTVPAQQPILVDYPGWERYDATLSNRSNRPVTVRVIDPTTGDQVRGFGLAPKGKATIAVDQALQLVVDNATDRAVTLRVTATETAPPSPQAPTSVSFILQNKSAQSIPLLIPSVMNPNLSPFSKSGVELKIGQEILFRSRGRKYVLLTVDDSIAPGDNIDVAALLKARKKALGL